MINWEEYNNKVWSYSLFFKFSKNWELVQCDSKHYKTIRIIHVPCVPTAKQFKDSSFNRHFQLGTVLYNGKCSKCSIMRVKHRAISKRFLLKAKMLDVNLNDKDF